MSVVKNILTLICLLLISMVAIYFFSNYAFRYFVGFKNSGFGDSFFNNQFWVMMHMVGGTLALLLGPVQFWKYLRTNFVRIHRSIGKLYILGSFLAGISGLSLSLVSHCRPCRISLFILAALLLITTSFAWYSILKRNTKLHRQFMIRSYVCIFSFVAVRIDDIVSLDFFFGQLQDSMFRRTANEYFFSFFPLLCCEILMVWIPSIRKLKAIR
jgi:Predicted membrane protein (DUF2306)